MRGRAWIVATALLVWSPAGRRARVPCTCWMLAPSCPRWHSLQTDARWPARSATGILLVDAESGTRIRELGPLPEQHLSLAYSRERLLSAGRDGYAACVGRETRH